MSQRIFPITMPKWGIEMQRGTITAWHAAPGDTLQKNAPLLDVETDKIVNSVEAPVSGVLRRILADSGSTEQVGALIAVFADASVSDTEVQRFIQAFGPANANSGSDEPAAASAHALFSPAPGAASPGGAAEVSQGSGAGEPRVSPIARRVAERLGVDIAQVKGTGRHGRISKEDVEAFAAARTAGVANAGAAEEAAGGDAHRGGPPASGAAQPAASAAIPGAESHPAGQAGADAQEPRRVKLSALRATIGRRLVESTQSIPHYRLAADVDFGALLARRESQRAAGANVSVNDFLVRAAGLALKDHPLLNSHLVGDEILMFPRADICVAVSTDGGLMTPVVRGAEGKSPADIGIETRALSHRARSGSLTRDEITGGTFTLSNLGMFGVDRFDAIINPPQVAILAVGALHQRVVARNGAPAIAPMATLTVSADHRVIDGAVGAAFLATLKSLIEDAGAL